MIWVTLCFATSARLGYSTNQPMRPVEQRFMLSYSFRYDQIYKIQIYDWGCTLFCYLSQTLRLNKQTYEAY